MIKRISSAFKGDGYQARAIRSTSMVLLNFGGENALRLLSNVILTRLLFPEAFGMMALVQVVIAGAAMFSDLGFRGAIIQHKRGDDPDFLNTAWTLQILRGLLLMTIIMALAGPAARFYEEPMLADLLMLAAVVPLINSFDSTKTLTANRTLQMERLTVMMLGSQFIGVAVTISLAWWLGTVWALGIGLLVAPSLRMILSHLWLEGHSNRLGLEKSAAWNLLTYGGFIFLASMGGFFVMHGDRAVLGKYVELDALAIYGIAALLAVVPRKLSHAIASKVIFPLYARRPPAESPSNRKKLNKARILVTVPLVFASAVFAIFGDLIVRILYDPRYESAGPYLVLLGLAGIPNIVTISYVQLPLASGHSAKFAMYQISAASIRLVLLLLLVPSYGLLGAIFTIPAAMLLIYPLLIYMIRPYKAWDPSHDCLALLVWIVLSAGVLWWNADVVRPVFEAVGLTYIL